VKDESGFPGPFRPRYLRAGEKGELRKRVELGLSALESCALCPRRCGVNRLEGENGFCRTGRFAVVSSAVPHHGEEPCISGSRGSGTIFFTHCNLACRFCQNYDISQLGRGEEVGPRELARIMLDLQNRGCHNINFVTPSHLAPQILEALAPAVEMGLEIPLVWNSGGYDGLETLALVDGLVDIYMPDFKYGREPEAVRLSRAPSYPDRAKEALREMYRQVGDLVLGDDGVAVRGLLVRHLVLPNDQSGTRECLKFLRSELSPRIGLSLMSQYRPSYKAREDPLVARGLSREEYEPLVILVEELGFEYAWVQHPASREAWFPDFNEEDPFRRWRR